MCVCVYTKWRLLLKLVVDGSKRPLKTDGIAYLETVLRCHLILDNSAQISGSINPSNISGGNFPLKFQEMLLLINIKNLSLIYKREQKTLNKIDNSWLLDWKQGLSVVPSLCYYCIGKLSTGFLDLLLLVTFFELAKTLMCRHWFIHPTVLCFPVTYFRWYNFKFHMLYFHTFALVTFKLYP